MLSLWKRFVKALPSPIRRRTKRTHTAHDVQNLEQRQLLTTLTLIPTEDVVLDGLHNTQANNGARPQLEFLQNAYRPLIEFNVESTQLLPEEIASATLVLYQLPNVNPMAPLNVQVLTVSRDWDEGNSFLNNTPGNGASWLNADADFSIPVTDPWSTPGGDFNTTFDFGNGSNGIVTTGQLSSGTAESYVDFDVSEAVKSWLAGDIDNHGFALLATSGGISEYQVASRNNNNAALRPRLIIETQEPTIPVTELAAQFVSVSEADSSVTVTVQRRGDVSEALAVSYSTFDLTAGAGVDYTTTVGTILFAANETSRQVQIPLLNDLADEPDEAFGFSLETASAGVVLKDTAIITILDDDVPVTTQHVVEITRDNHLNNLQNPESNLGGRMSLQLLGPYRPLLDFDLPALPISPDDVLSADLELTRFGAFNTGILDVDVRVLDRDWVEGTGFANNVSGNGSSWLYADADFTDAMNPVLDPWVTPGGDFNTTFDFGNGANGVVSSTTTPQFNGGNDVVSFDARSAVQAFYAGALTNYGLALEVTSSNFNENNFFSSEATNPANRPKLIIEEAQAATLSVDSSDQVFEGETLVIAVDRSGTTSGSVTVDYTTQPSTADGSDFIAVSGTLTFGDGEARKLISIPITLDAVGDSGEVFTLQLSNPSARAVLGNSTNTVTILEGAGTLSVVPDVSFVNETDGTMTFTVVRTGGQNGTVGIDYATTDGSAFNSFDYTAVAGSLSFAPGETSKTIVVPILDDGLFEPSELFGLNLSNPTGGANVGDGSATGLIVSEDPPGVGEFSMFVADVSVNEATGTVSLTVVRNGGAIGTVQVDFSSANGSAIAGDDYTAVSGTLVFDDGVLTQTIELPILNDPATEGDETLTVTLSNPQSGATLGPVTTTTVTIAANQGPTGIFLYNGTLIVNGTGQDDRVTFTQNNGQVNVTASLPAFGLSTHHPSAITQSFNMADVQSIHVATFEGRDYIGLQTIMEQPALLETGADHDQVWAANGDTTVNGGAGNDFINTLNGDDLIIDLEGQNTVQSNNGDDTVFAGSGNDTISTGNGNDEINDAGGINRVLAGAGNNTVTTGDGPDYIETGWGNDVIDAGNGINTVSAGDDFNVVTTGDDLDDITTGNQADTINSGAGNDTIRSNNGNDEIDSGEGNDKVFPGGGNDLVLAGNGTNTVTDTGGDNTIISGSGNDTITTSSGNDIIFAGDGWNQIFDGGGNNFVVTGVDTDIINTGGGNDTILAGSGNNNINAGAGRNTVVAESGNDTILGPSGFIVGRVRGRRSERRWRS